MKYSVYILYSRRINKYYTGSSLNVRKRIEEHNSGKNRYSRQAKDWQLVYQEEFGSKIEALRKEKQIKRYKSRKYIKKLVEKFRGVEQW